MSNLSADLPEKAGLRNFVSQDGKASWYVVGLLSALGMLAYFDRLVLNLLIDPIRSDLRISDTQMGVLIGPAFALTMLLALGPVAWITDRGNRKLMLVGGVLLWSIMTTTSAFASSYGFLLFCRGGVGIGEAVLTPVALSMVGDLFRLDRRPTPAGMFIASQTLGAGSSFVVVALLLYFLDQIPTLGVVVPGGASPWRVVLFLAGFPGIILALVFFFTVKEPARAATKSLDFAVPHPAPQLGTAETWTPRGLAFRFYLPFLVAVNVAGMMAYLAASWFPVFLIRQHHVPVSKAGLLYGAAAFMSVLGPLLFSFITGRKAARGDRTVLIKLVLVGVPVLFGAFCLALSLKELPIIGLVLVFSLILNTGIGSAGSLVIATIGGTDARGRLSGFHLLVQSLLGMTLAPVMVPLLSEHLFDGDLGASMLASACAIFPISFVLFLASRRPYLEIVERVAAANGADGAPKPAVSAGPKALR